MIKIFILVIIKYCGVMLVLIYNNKEIVLKDVVLF